MPPPSSFRFAGALFALVLSACASTNTVVTVSDHDPTDPASASSGGSSGDSAPAICNAITSTATDVVRTTVDDRLPAATGGAIADGTYHLSAVVQHARDDGSPVRAHDGKLIEDVWRETVVVDGSGMEIVGSRNGKADSTESDTIAIDGTSLTLLATCPTMATHGTFGYSARDGEFWLHNTHDSILLVFTRQP